MPPSDKKDTLLAQLLHQDPRYPRAAYDFILDATLFLCAEKREAGAKEAHLTGQQLSEGLRDLLLQRYGAMAIDVLNLWNIHRTEDFGNLVYNLISVSLLSSSSEDRREDFNQVFDFQESFVAPFLLKKRAKPLPVFL